MHSIIVSLVSNVLSRVRANSFLILSIRAIAKCISGPVTKHICEPDIVYHQDYIFMIIKMTCFRTGLYSDLRKKGEI
jgi:hypothetical protein